MATFGEEIKQLREAKGLTQKALAEAVGISPPFLSQIEAGIRQGTSNASQLFAFADALGVPVEHFRPFILDVPADPPPATPAKKKPRKT